MGRGRRRRRYGSASLLADRGDIRRAQTESEFTETVYRDYKGASGHFAYEKELVTYNERDELEIDRASVRKELENLKQEVIQARELPKEEFIGYAKQAAGVSGDRAAANAADREYQARARVLLTAARLSDVEVTPADKRILNPLAEGRFMQTVYGKKGRYEGGTLATGFTGKGGKSSDASARARAEDSLKYLKGQEWRDR